MLSLGIHRSRMANLARQEMYFGRFFTLDELIESVERIIFRRTCKASRRRLRSEASRPYVLGSLNGSHFA